MKAIAPRKDRCSSIFCGNCERLVFPCVKPGTAELLERKNAAMYCDECRPHAQALQDANTKASRENEALNRLRHARMYSNDDLRRN